MTGIISGILYFLCAVATMGMVIRDWRKEQVHPPLFDRMLIVCIICLLLVGGIFCFRVGLG